MSTVRLEIGQDIQISTGGWLIPPATQSYDLSPGLAADLAAGIANLLSGRGDYSRRHFGVSEESPLVRIVCKGFYVAVRWQAPAREETFKLLHTCSTAYD